MRAYQEYRLFLAVVALSVAMGGSPGLALAYDQILVNSTTDNGNGTLTMYGQFSGHGEATRSFYGGWLVNLFTGDVCTDLKDQVYKEALAMSEYKSRMAFVNAVQQMGHIVLSTKLESQLTMNDSASCSNSGANSLGWSITYTAVGIVDSTYEWSAIVQKPVTMTMPYPNP